MFLLYGGRDRAIDKPEIQLRFKEIRSSLVLRCSMLCLESFNVHMTTVEVNLHTSYILKRTAADSLDVGVINCK